MISVEELNAKLSKVTKDSPQERIKGLFNVLSEYKGKTGEALLEVTGKLEKVVYEICDLMANHQKDGLDGLFQKVEDIFSVVSNAKSAKLISKMLKILSAPGVSWGLDLPTELCKTVIARCREKNRRNLAHRAEQKLCEIYYRTKNFEQALKNIKSLLKEIKRLDDKLLLVELHLLESKIQHSLRDIAKAKAALTASRASASSVYVSPDLQAEVDLQGGAVATEEGDYKTGFSYFYEAFEGCRVQKDLIRANRALIYMLLCKVMSRKFKDLNSLVSSKSALEFAGPEIDRMHAISKACEKRSVKELEQVLADHPKDDDTLLEGKLKELCDTIQEENLLKFLEPYSKVQISHIAKLIELPVNHVTKRLSHMILDKKLNGILDQGAGAIIMYEEETEDKTFEYALETLVSLEDVVDKLLTRSIIRKV